MKCKKCRKTIPDGSKYCNHCGAPDCPAECYWGLVTSDCVPQPAYYAVKEAIKECYRDE